MKKRQVLSLLLAVLLLLGMIPVGTSVANAEELPSVLIEYRTATNRHWYEPDQYQRPAYFYKEQYISFETGFPDFEKQYLRFEGAVDPKLNILSKFATSDFSNKLYVAVLTPTDTKDVWRHTQVTKKDGFDVEATWDGNHYFMNLKGISDSLKQRLEELTPEQKKQVKMVISTAVNSPDTTGQVFDFVGRKTYPDLQTVRWMDRTNHQSMRIQFTEDHSVFGAGRVYYQDWTSIPAKSEYELVRKGVNTHTLRYMIDFSKNPASFGLHTNQFLKFDDPSTPYQPVLHNETRTRPQIRQMVLNVPLGKDVEPYNAKHYVNEFSLLKQLSDQHKFTKKVYKLTEFDIEMLFDDGTSYSSENEEKKSNLYYIKDTNTMKLVVDSDLIGKDKKLKNVTVKLYVDVIGDNTVLDREPKAFFEYSMKDNQETKMSIDHLFSFLDKDAFLKKDAELLFTRVENNDDQPTLPTVKIIAPSKEFEYDGTKKTVGGKNMFTTEPLGLQLMSEQGETIDTFGERTEVGESVVGFPRRYDVVKDQHGKKYTAIYVDGVLKIMPRKSQSETAEYEIQHVDAANGTILKTERKQGTVGTITDVKKEGNDAVVEVEKLGYTWKEVVNTTIQKDKTSVVKVMYTKNKVVFTADSKTVKETGSLQQVNTYTAIPYGVYRNMDNTAIEVSGKGTNAGTYPVEFKTKHEKVQDGQGKVYFAEYRSGVLTIQSTDATKITIQHLDMTDGRDAVIRTETSYASHFDRTDIDSNWATIKEVEREGYRLIHIENVKVNVNGTSVVKIRYVKNIATFKALDDSVEENGREQFSNRMFHVPSHLKFTYLDGSTIRAEGRGTRAGRYIIDFVRKDPKVMAETGKVYFAVYHSATFEILPERERLAFYEIQHVDMDNNASVMRRESVRGRVGEMTTVNESNGVLQEIINNEGYRLDHIQNVVIQENGRSVVQVAYRRRNVVLTADSRKVEYDGNTHYVDSYTADPVGKYMDLTGKKITVQGGGKDVGRYAVMFIEKPSKVRSEEGVVYFASYKDGALEITTSKVAPQPEIKGAVHFKADSRRFDYNGSRRVIDTYTTSQTGRFMNLDGTKITAYGEGREPGKYTVTFATKAGTVKDQKGDLYLATYEDGLLEILARKNEYAPYYIEHIEKHEKERDDKIIRRDRMDGKIGTRTDIREKDRIIREIEEEGYTFDSIRNTEIRDDGRSVVRIYYKKNDVLLIAKDGKAKYTGKKQTFGGYTTKPEGLDLRQLDNTLIIAEAEGTEVGIYDVTFNTRRSKVKDKNGKIYFAEYQDGKFEIEPDAKVMPYPMGPTLNKMDHRAYITGYPDGTFKPKQRVTREEAVSIFYRLLDQRYKDQVQRSVTPLFADVDMNRWSYEAINFIASGNIVSGYPDGRFKPTAPITRAEVAKIASKFDQMAFVTGNPFKDVKGHWAEQAILSAAQKGWIKGYPDGTFKPNAPITREELVMVINNVLDRRVESAGVLQGHQSFRDVRNKTVWSYYPIIAAANSYLYETYIKNNLLYQRWTQLIR